MLASILLKSERFCVNCLRRNVQKFATSVPHEPVRVRFAPSPTGYLHIGGLRTALTNYLFAKSKGGEFIIRIEDTDQTRVVSGAVTNLIKQLTWMGIIPDEGPSTGQYGPYVQSERLNIYKQYANQLLESGAAYRCFCSEKRLEILRRDQRIRNEVPRYDNRCRSLSLAQIEEKLKSGESYALRLVLAAGDSSFMDMFNGEIRINVTKTEGDPIIYKSDGYPTYHLANVVDDHLMNITHVLRGKEWIYSTTKHLMLYEAFGWTPPQFGHLPLFLNEDGNKLSKRQGDVFVEQYREKSYHPSALLNYMGFCGLGFSDGSTILGDELSTPASVLGQMISSFSLNRVKNSDTVLQNWKLNEFNSSILKHLLQIKSGRNSLVEALRLLVANKYGKNSLLSDLKSEDEINRYIERVIVVRQAHINTLEDLISTEYKYVWQRPDLQLQEQGQHMVKFTNDTCKLLSTLTEDTEMHVITSKLRSIIEQHGLKMPPAMTLLRRLLIGRKDGPGVAEIIYTIGNIESIKRLKQINFSAASFI